MSHIENFSPMAVPTLKVADENQIVSALAANLVSASNEPASVKLYSLPAVANGSRLAEPSVAEPPVPSGSPLREKLVGIKNCLQNSIPNHLILQFGPQIKDPDTGIDFKFTPTVVLAGDHIEGYLWHTEIGTVIKTGSDAVNGYVLGVKQQGIEYNWNEQRLSYNRQELGRFELDFPYGKSGLQFTLALELGITSKTRTLAKSLQHAVQDTLTQVPAGTILLNNAFQQAGIFGPLIGLLSVPAVMDRILEWSVPGGNQRDNYLWFGLSVGYADYNGTVFPNLNNLEDPSLPGVNLQANVYLRHGSAMTYDFQSKKVTIPYIMQKLLGNYYHSLAEFIKDALQSRDALSRELTKAVANGAINTQVKSVILNIADEIIKSGGDRLDVQQANQSERDGALVNSAFEFIYQGTSAEEINSIPRDMLAQKIARSKQAYVIVERGAEGLQVFDIEGNVSSFGQIKSTASVITLYDEGIEHLNADLAMINIALTKGYSNIELLQAMAISPEQIQLPDQ
ncbi:hypothetical protein [Winslowiella iniecta]|uniref:Uncharacterized protein n=1 Tax=Winslowiella iniecta TaxID=1560201 RepID=A0A0L7T8C9_9GAMM|nr:hypothetical protein [Winslowiella iniecta]KOC91619.1 hypothetical protein NG42_05115 [Winslowiella iniecta]KOC94430.1 hypothetical protein NG43_04390 [Winslowiella iniecta]